MSDTAEAPAGKAENVPWRRARLVQAAARLNQGLPPLALFCDDQRLPNPLETAENLPKGAMVVVRARSPARRRELAVAMMPTAHRRGLYLLIAGDGALARRLRCGLHLPEAHMAEIPRWRCRSVPFITAAAHSLRALGRAFALGADAAFLSPVFATRSHPAAAGLGGPRASLIAHTAALPVYALGGITGQTALRVNGFVGLAAIDALKK